MQKMTADRAFPYRGSQMKVGQEFDADDQHVGLFTLIGFAHVKEGNDAGRKQEYRTRHMTARKAAA